MDQAPAKVVTLDSDSENELEIISESIPNYGNYSTPVEIAPELQEKIRNSLEKRASLPGKIKTIKVYATKRSSQMMGSVRASFRPPGGRPTKTINVGASINDLFSSQVRGGRNNNSKKPKMAAPSDLAKHVQDIQKRSDEPLPVGAVQRVTDRPPTPNSPVILYSPIKKGKTAKMKDILDGALPTQQTVVHLPQDPSPVTPSLVPYKKNVSQNLDGETVSQENSKTDMENTEDLSLRDLDSNTGDKVFKNVCTNVNPVELSPVRFSSDDDEQSVEDSIMGIWNSPVPSPRNYVNPLLDLEQNSSFVKMNGKDCDVSEDSKDLVVNEETLENMPMYLVKEMWAKMNEEDNISKKKYLYEKETKMNEEEESNLEKLFDQDGQDYNGESKNILYNETEIVTDAYNEDLQRSEKQNSNKFAVSKYIKINVETLPKRLLGSSGLNTKNDSVLNMRSDKYGSERPLWSTDDGSEPILWGTKDGSEPPLWSTKDGNKPPLWSTKDGNKPPLWSIKDGNDPPLWSTIFPPSPPSPPPERWMSSSALWELDAGGFGAFNGLCDHQTANDLKSKLNAPKPLVRVLRKRHN